MKTPKDQKPLQKSSEALRFLNMLGRTNFEFRVISDQKAGSAAESHLQLRRYIGTFDVHKSNLRQLNDQGFGIFVQVNGSDGQGNKAQNITETPCLFADLDGPPLENLQRLGLQPHAIIETSPGKYHAYWLIDGLTIQQFKPLQQRLAKLFDSDKAVVDLPRLMRLPGFMHMKNPQAPFLTHFIKFEEMPRYSVSEFLAALREAEDNQGIGRSVVQSDRPKPLSTRIAEVADAKRARDAIDFLIQTGNLDVGNYDEWSKLGMGLKHSLDEAGFVIWHEFSAISDGYKGEDDCRQKWNSFSNDCEKPLTIATYIARAKDLGWKWPQSRRKSKDEKSPAPAVIAATMAKELGDAFWMDHQGTPHVSFAMQITPELDRLIHAPVDSTTYRELLYSRYNAHTVTEVLGKEQLNSAILLLKVEAQKGDKHHVFLRSGRHGDDLYIDLGREDGQVVRVNACSWEVLSAAPIRFLYRGKGLGELPIPIQGGSLDTFHNHYNVSPHDVTRIIAFQMAALMTVSSYPILLILGQQGTGKSTLGDMVISLIDPPVERKHGRMSFASNEQNLFVRSKHTPILFFDNISVVDHFASDALCRIVTGGTMATRKLYTDDDEHLVSVTRPVIATCIGAPTSRGDFLDRSVTIEALPVENRKTEKCVWSEFESDRPAMFGALLTAISMSMKNATQIEADISAGRLPVPRLADFAAVAEGACEFFNMERGEFSAWELQCQRHQQAEASLGNPFIEALLRFVSRSEFEPMECFARELIDKLAREYFDIKAWPATNQVAKIISRNHDGLIALGVKVEIIPAGGHANAKRYRVSRLDGFQPLHSEPPVEYF